MVSDPAPFWAFLLFGALCGVLGFLIARHVYHGRDKFR